MGLQEDPATSELEALKLRLRTRIAAEHRDHPFPLSELQQIEADREARWKAVTSESWHHYTPSIATRKRRDAEILRDASGIAGSR